MEEIDEEYSPLPKMLNKVSWVPKWKGILMIPTS
jgi:hypothetical protein